MKFKAGDRVLYRNLNEIGTVQAVVDDDKGFNYVVRWDNGEMDRYQSSQLSYLVAPEEVARAFNMNDAEMTEFFGDRTDKPSEVAGKEEEKQ